MSDVLSWNPAVAELAAPDAHDLLDRARAGETEAFCELVRIHEHGLLRQATALCGDPTLAEDLAQDTLLEAWRCLHRYNGQCRFFTWLCAVLLHRYRNTLRKKRPWPLSAFARAHRDEVERRLNQSPDQDPRPDEAAQLHEQAARVRACVQALPPKHQQVIYLRFYVDDSLAGIAAALGCSVGTVKSRLFHALEKLRGMNDLRGQHSGVDRSGAR